jgi:hypothetical protein
MNIKEAVKLLLEGKKIRLSRWREERYLKKYPPDLSLVLNQFNEEYRITLSDMLADDWEIYF